MDPALFESRKRLLPIFRSFCGAFSLGNLAQPADPNAPIEYHLQGSTMGTTYSIRVRGPQSVPRTENTESRQRRGAEAALKRVNLLMSTWIDESEINQFNRAGSDTAFKVSTETLQVLRLSHEVSMLSGGAFDVTVGPLVDAYGFGSGKERAARCGNAWMRSKVALASSLFNTFLRYPANGPGASG